MQHLRSIVLIGVPLALGILPDGYFDSLGSKTFAQWRALDDTRELLGGVDLELFGVDESEHRSPGLVQPATSGIANVDEVHAESVEWLVMRLYDVELYIPKPAFCADGQVLQDKPVAKEAVGVPE